MSFSVLNPLKEFKKIYPHDAWELLSPKLSEERMQRLLRVVTQRTQYIRLMVQDLRDPHNISACIRSADAFGVLGVDVVTKHHSFAPSTAARGSGQWLEIKRWRSIEEAGHGIKTAGYKIAAGFPSENARSLYDLPIDQPLVLLFGNEKHGLDQEWEPHLDYKFTIPTRGMVESLNISVSAALTLCEVTRRALEYVGPKDYFIDSQKQHELLCEWVCRHHSRFYEIELAKLRHDNQMSCEER